VNAAHPSAGQRSTPPPPPAGLPGASADPGSGPVSPALLDLLLDDAALLTVPADAGNADARNARAGKDAEGVAVAAVVDRHRVLLDGPATEQLVGPLLVPAGRAEDVVLALQPSDHAMRLLLVPDHPSGATPTSADVAEQLQELRAARNLFLDDDRAEVVGIHVPLPAEVPAPDAVRAVIDALDFTVPAWLQPVPRPGWLDALAVLAEDGAEGVAATGAGPLALSDTDLAALLRTVVDHELTVRIVGGPLPLIRESVETTGPHGALNVICAVRAALNGAEAPELAGILATTHAAGLLSAVRRMSDADSVVVRAFLAAVPAAPVEGAVAGLAALALLATETR
jgi:hypothetical protein